MAFNLVYLSQQDPKWKNDPLGFATDPRDTIGYVGCALTSVSMLLSGYGFAETPQTLNQKLKNKQGFVNSGIRWDVVNHVHPEVRLKSNVACENTDAPIGEINAWLAAGHPVVVRVDASPNPGLQWHYVLVYGLDGDDYLILDPWPYKPGTANKDYLMKRYSQGRPLKHAIQQVLFYEATGAGGPIATPAGTPQTQPTTSPTPGGGVYARVMDSVTWGLNVRSSTDTSSMANVVASVPAGTQLLVLDANDAAKIGRSNQWVRVREPGGREGFSAAWFLETATATTPAPVTEPTPGPVSEPTSSTTPATTPSSTPSTTPSATPSTPTEPPKDKLTVMVSEAVGTSGLRLRKTPSKGGTLIMVLKAGTKLTVVEPANKAKAKVGRINQWIYVREPNGNRGYVGAEYVKLA